METIAEIVSANIRLARKKLGITQAELAERTGLSTTTIQQIERKEVWLGRATIEALTKALQCSEAALFQAENAAMPAPTITPIEALKMLEPIILSAGRLSPAALAAIQRLNPHQLQDLELAILAMARPEEAAKAST